jgi:hypothetical protein
LIRVSLKVKLDTIYLLTMEGKVWKK